MANEYSKKRPQTKRILVPQYRAPEIYLGGVFCFVFNKNSSTIVLLICGQLASSFLS
ncbi:unnamed protein product [Paramecium primaurelia]|uniref:Uncharacterized protein n=1 Tax=Paramecium primaurelia TaxID=5886 RepID=A0A8S1MLX0_PARPR|nr:unnamed protein product [Paramecium primaurelia]